MKHINIPATKNKSIILLIGMLLLIHAIYQLIEFKIYIRSSYSISGEDYPLVYWSILSIEFLFSILVITKSLFFLKSSKD